MSYVITRDAALRTISLSFDDQSESDNFYNEYTTICRYIPPPLTETMTFHYVSDGDYDAGVTEINDILGIR